MGVNTASDISFDRVNQHNEPITDAFGPRSPGIATGERRFRA